MNRRMGDSNLMTCLLFLQGDSNDSEQENVGECKGIVGTVQVYSSYFRCESNPSEETSNCQWGTSVLTTVLKMRVNQPVVVIIL
jgi:hypothetical protein